MNFRFGKLPPKQDYRTLLFRDYATALPAPPPTYDGLAHIAKLGKQTSTLFPMDGNDRYGDCTIAAKAHAVSLARAFIGKVAIPTEKSIIKNYFKLSGGIDSGLNMLDVLNDWRKVSFDRDKLISFVKINPRNHAHVMQAASIFGCVYVGFQVQQNCMDDFNNGKPWTPGRLTNDGHCVDAVGYDANGLTLLTWGTTQQGTWGWWDECVDEAYALLMPEAKVAGFAPGFDFAALQADLEGVAS